ncbi:hypothetical protein F5Y17DRAFT_352570 [Xylariaceae sp. FL0594]|nr:hypothetical protein F5Y17DRAFT_352570 [Xylariaceae sp. FL0594]
MRSAVVSCLALASLFQRVVALEVTPGSTCAALCLDKPASDSNDPRSSTTTPHDIACTDDDYNTSPHGIKFQNCIECLRRSNATSETENDTSWFLYNVRYSLDVCLFSYPNKSSVSQSVSSPCDTRFACQPVKTALEAGITNPAWDPYAYCSADGGAFSAAAADACIQCLTLSSNQKYLPNFITVLKAGCEQKPAPGGLLGLSGSLFASHPVNITAPPVPLGSGPNGGSSSAFTTGAIVGIAVGAALLLLGGSALFWVYHRKQKRLYSAPLNSKFGPPSRHGAVPPPRAGFASMGGMPPMANHELRTNMPHNKNAAYYNAELEKDMPLGQNVYNPSSGNPGLGLHTVLPAHPAYNRQTHSRQTFHEAETTVQPKTAKSNRPDSYAIQTYINANEEATSRSMAQPPPYLPPPAAVPRPSSVHARSSSLAHDLYEPPRSHSRDSSIGSGGPSPDRRPLLSSQDYSRWTSLSAARPPPPPPYQKQQQMQQTQFSVPPPPPRAPKVPALNMPSLSKLRVPKKYSPPVITVQGATPVEKSSTAHQGRSDGSVPIGINISGPLGVPRSRFHHSDFD